MTAKEAQLTELLSLPTRTLTHLTAAITAIALRKDLIDHHHHPALR
jgi:hypothetical protein